jgi:hypothetical protein
VSTRRIKSPAAGVYEYTCTYVDACDRVGLVRPPTAKTSRHREASQRSVVPLCHASHRVPHSHGSGHQLRRVAQRCVATRRTTLFQRSVSTKWDRARWDRARLVRPLPRTTNFATSRRGRHKPRPASPRVGSRRGGWRHGRHGRHGQGAEASRDSSRCPRFQRSQLNNAG